MPSSGFLPTLDIERLLAGQPDETKDIVLEIRNLVAGACPGASESILWGGLSYHDAARGGRVKGAICMIELSKQHGRHEAVQLSFIHGVRLTDPEGLLRGGGQGSLLSKRVVEIASYDEGPWEAIRGLIEEAAALDPQHFGPI